MLKLSLGYSEDRQAHVVALGLSDGNLARLQKGQPIRVNCNDLELPSPGVDLLLIYANHREHLEHLLETMVTRLTGQDSGRIVCLCLEGLYVTCLPQKSDRMLYIVGMDSVTYKLLRDKHHLRFRSRTVTGEMTNIEVVLFWGKTEEDLIEGSAVIGQIGPHTAVKKLKE